MTDDAKDPDRALFTEGGPGGPGRPPSPPPTPEQCRIAKNACRLGATDQDLAAILGVGMHVLRRWQVTDEAFSHACKVGGDMADARVERALFSRAVGFTRKISKEQVTKDGDIVELITIEEVAPDTAAASRWLEARKRKDWGIKSVVQHEGDIEVRDSRSALAKLIGRHRERSE